MGMILYRHMFFYVAKGIHLLNVDARIGSLFG
jgi:hypothetical protein